MNFDQKFTIVKEGKVFVDHGPITMIIEAKIKDIPYTDAAIKGACRSIEILNQLIPYVSDAKKLINDISQSEKDYYPLVLKKMIDTVSLLGEKDFTAMASVAGTISDLVRAKVLECGADYVVVNNGGDISYQLPYYKDHIRVGIISNLSNKSPTHVITINSNSGIRGVATSGFGGRGLTKGIASAVTVLAYSGSLADAAATSIANATNDEDTSIERCLAEELDYNTDIKGALVTKSIGNISEECIKAAIRNGLKRADDLYRIGMIKGAAIFVRNNIAVYPQKQSYFTISEIN